jgi:hypothetical protein
MEENMSYQIFIHVKKEDLLFYDLEEGKDYIKVILEGDNAKDLDMHFHFGPGPDEGM